MTYTLVPKRSSHLFENLSWFIFYPLECIVYINNKPKGLRVSKEDKRLIGSMFDRLDGR